MASRVLDSRLATLEDDADVGVVSGQVAVILSELHLTIQAKKYDLLLAGAGFDTVGSLQLLTETDLFGLGVAPGHISLLMIAFFPPPEDPDEPPPIMLNPVVVPTSPPPPTPRSRNGPEFCELSASGAPDSKGFRAWVIKFIVHLHLLVLPSTIQAVRQAGQDPLNLGAEWLVSSEQGRIVFDALVGCGTSGLPSDLLLSFSPDILTSALGVAAIAFISRMVLVVTDEGAAVLQAWFNQPPPVTKKWMLGPGLVQWSRTLEQLVACACAPSLVAQRLSLYHLVSKIPELVPELAALRVACKDPAGIAINDVVALVRAKGEAFNSEKQTQQAVANMCFAGVADETTVVDESKIPCRFWKSGTCRFGSRCKWLHEGPAGIANVAKRHPRGAKKTNKKSSSQKLSQAHELKAMLLKLLKGAATNLNTSLTSVLTKICGRWQTPQKFQNPTQNSVAVVVVESQKRKSDVSVRPAASVVGRQSPQSSVHPDSDSRLRPSAPCDIKALTKMVSSEINLDIPFNKNSLLQESPCLNTKIIKDVVVKDTEVNVEVSEVDVEGAVKFLEARLPLGVDAAQPCSVPTVKPLGAAHQGPCQLECNEEVSSLVPSDSVACLGLMPSALAAAWETAVVGDTGATVAIIGEPHVHLAVNISKLHVPISVSTASGLIELTHTGDLPGCFGLMDGAYLNPKCKHSLCPVVKRCEDLGVGFTVSEGATSASFHKGGKTVVDLDVSSGLPTFRVSALPGSLILSAKAAFMALAFIVTGTAASADCHDHPCLVSAKQPDWMLQHDLDGHRPARPDCPYCKQAGLRETRAFRVPHSHRTEKTGYHLAGDFSGPHPPSVDGQTYAFQ